MMYNETTWENLSALIGGCLLASLATAVLSIIFWSIELFISAVGLLVVAAVLDTVQANIDPARYNRGDF